MVEAEWKLGALEGVLVGCWSTGRWGSGEATLGLCNLTKGGDDGGKLFGCWLPTGNTFAWGAGNGVDVWGP